MAAIWVSKVRRTDGLDWAKKEERKKYDKCLECKFVQRKILNKLLLIVVFLFVLQSIKWKFAFILKIPYFIELAGERERERGERRRCEEQ